jgi:PhnB protein
MGTVRPYPYGPAALVDWVKQTSGADELERAAAENGEHLELRIGDSVVVLETGDALPAFAAPASVYIYVEDVDATYERAMAGGAESLGAPENKPYEERGAGVKDSFGNTWWLATYTGARTPVYRLVSE